MESAERNAWNGYKYLILGANEADKSRKKRCDILEAYFFTLLRATGTRRASVVTFIPVIIYLWRRLIGLSNE